MNIREGKCALNSVHVDDVKVFWVFHWTESHLFGTQPYEELIEGKTIYVGYAWRNVRWADSWIFVALESWFVQGDDAPKLFEFLLCLFLRDKVHDEIGKSAQNFFRADFCLPITCHLFGVRLVECEVQKIFIKVIGKGGPFSSGGWRAKVSSAILREIKEHLHSFTCKYNQYGLWSYFNNTVTIKLAIKYPAWPETFLQW